MSIPIYCLEIYICFWVEVYISPAVDTCNISDYLAIGWGTIENKSS